MGKRFITVLLTLLFVGVSAFAQSSVSGKVTDQSGEPLVGASVLVKGTSTGTMTDLDGQYSLSGLKTNAVLVFSSIGYETQEVTVGSQKTINVTLADEAEFLNDVVVVAYGTQKKRDLTGAMTAIKGDNIKAQNVSSVSRALEGAAPGIQLSSVDGQPGVDMAIRVRGASSTSEGSAVALVVIDGVPAQTSNPLSTINPSDIESISVLKDAASTALYGSRGANGVILINTKKGHEGKTQVSFDARVGWNSVGQFNMSNMTEASDIYEFAWLSIYNSYRYGVNGTGKPGVGADGIPYTNFQNPNYSHEEAAEFASQHLFNYVNSETKFERNALKNALVYDVPGARYEFSGGTGTSRSATMLDAYLVNTNGKLNPNAVYFLPDDCKYDNIFNSAFRQEYNASLRGGTDKLNYFASLGYDTDPSYIPTSSFNRYTGRVSVNAQPLKWLKIGSNIGYTRTTTNEMATRYGRNAGGAGGNVFRYVNGTSSLISIYMLDENHNYVYDSEGNKLENVTNSTETYSPLGPTTGNAFGKGVWAEFDKNKNETIRSIFTTRSYAQVLFTKDLNLLVNFNYDSDDTDYLRYRAAGTYNGGTNGGLNKTLTNRFILNNQILLNYSHDFKGGHHFDAMAGHEWNSDKYNSVIYVSGYELIPGWISAGNFIGRYTNGGTTLSGSPGWTQYEVNMESYIGRVNYNYNEKYYLSGSLRRDGSSKFMNNKWGNFGSVGASWVISKEGFMSGTSAWLDFLKIRGSYGILGNSNGISSYTNHTWSYSATSYNSTTGGNGIPAGYKLTSGGLVNEQLTWEKNQELDFGLDFSFWNHRVTGAIDYYNHRTPNAFYNADYSALAGSGSSTLTQNAAVLRNRGLELELSVDIIRTDDMTLTFSTNGTHYRTTLIDVPDENIPDNTNLDLPQGTWQAGVAAFSTSGTSAVSIGYLRGEGRDWYNIYLYKYAGVDKTSGLPMYWHRVTNADLGLNDDGTARSGGYASGGRYKDLKAGDNVKTLVSSDASLYEMGSATPDWIGGFNIKYRYKNLDFSTQFAYQLGGKFFSTEYANGLYRSGSLSATSEQKSTELIGNTFTENNTSAYFPMQWWNTDYYDGTTFGSWKYTDMALFSASYLKCKNVTIGYTLPKKLLDAVKASAVRVYASADNLFYVSAKKGVDPSMSILGGFEVGQYVYPAMRTFSLGVNITF
jgi:TonB-linked SusC/RagA family outer membrane protein